MTVSIRPFVPADYDRLAPLFAAVYPDYPGELAETRHADAIREARYRFQRWVIERDDALIGLGEYNQEPDMYHPRKFQFNVMIHPDHRRQGLGSALYDHMTRALSSFKPIALYSYAREDHQDGITFLQQRGYVESMREWESHLTVAEFDPAPYAAIEQQVRARGIEIKTLAELASDPERDHKLHRLHVEVGHDVPYPDRQTPLSFDYWVKSDLNAPNRLANAYFVAVDRETYVGLSYVNAVEGAGDQLETGLTGVRRDYRRQGIALALKLRALAFARAHGYRLIKTWNEAGNEAMLSINRQLGFVRQPAWIVFTKRIKASAYSTKTLT